MTNQNNTKRIIAIDNAPKAIGPYSQGVEINNTFYFSGMLPIDPTTGKFVPGGTAEQTEQIFKNIDALLKSQNLTSQNVIKATVFLKDLKDFAAMNEKYAQYFSTNPPARSCVEVARLPLDALVEIEVIAIR